MGAVSVLLVAEKPSLAESIATILSNGKVNTRRGVACNVHEYKGTFMGKDAQFKCTSVMGHVYSVDFPAEYNNWQAVEPVKLFNAPVVKLESNPKQHIVKHLQVESKGIDYLVLFLDADREGENICFEVIKVTQPNMRSPDNGKPKRTHIFRAKFSSITAPEIKKAMTKLGKPDENQSKAVDVRQELDLKIGCAFTRFQTKYFQGKYGNLDSRLVSFGPCQTPTLALCVKRHDEILSFEPRKYWSLSALIDPGCGPLRFQSTRGRIFEKKRATDIREGICSFRDALIVKVVVERKSIQRPQALNTVEMLKNASTGLGISPQQCMHLAERLYIQGYISYPRTETTKYSKEFDMKGLLATMSDQPLWGAYAKQLLQDGFTWPEGGKDVGDHPPITPVAMASEYELSGDSWRLYDFICRYFIGTLSSNCKYNRVTLTCQIGGGEQFTASGRTIISPGFTDVMHWRDTFEEDDNFQLANVESLEGQSVPVSEVAVKEGETTPPEYLTESDLIGLMEKLGIGTDASMAVHIANVCDRRYTAVQGTKRFMVPSDLGIVLIHGYQKIDPELALPTLRADMERKISLIADGKATDSDILKSEIEIYQRKFENFMAKIERMDELFEVTFSPLASSGKVFGKCGKCRRYMHYIALRPQRLHCRTCQETYSLPQGGVIKLYNELRCPLDNFELVLHSTGSKGKGYPVCPHCYNNPPFPEVQHLESSGMGCNMCPNDQCMQSLAANWTSPCTEQLCSGMLVLDATSAPRWKLCCNKCNLVAAFDDSVHHVQLTRDEQFAVVACEDCGARCIDVTFGKKAEREDLEGVCLNCDDEVAGLMATKLVRSFGNGRRGGGRGRGGRRGRRGGGRGRRGGGGH